MTEYQVYVLFMVVLIGALAVLAYHKNKSTAEQKTAAIPGGVGELKVGVDSTVFSGVRLMRLEQRMTRMEMENSHRTSATNRLTDMVKNAAHFRALEVLALHFGLKIDGRAGSYRVTRLPVSVPVAVDEALTRAAGEDKAIAKTLKDPVARKAFEAIVVDAMARVNP